MAKRADALASPKPLAGARRRLRVGLPPPPEPPDTLHVFSFRCPRPLVARMDEARWRLRVSSRTALMQRAIEDYLDRNPSDGRGLDVSASA